MSEDFDDESSVDRVNAYESDSETNSVIEGQETTSEMNAILQGILREQMETNRMLEEQKEAYDQLHTTMKSLSGAMGVLTR